MLSNRVPLILGLLLLVFLSGCGAIPSPTPADPTLPPTPTRLPTLAAEAGGFAKNQRLGRGINLGYALEAPQTEGQLGVTIQPSYFPLIRAAGFASVRLPVRWNAHALADSPYTIDPAFFARVDQVIAQALQPGLAVVIDFHNYNELYADPAGQGPRFVALWQQIAAQYRDYSPELYFELLNEPQGQLTAALWNTLFAQALAQVRATNPTRAVIVGPAGGYSIAGLNRLQLPAQDTNLIVTFHYYNPLNFTHQNDPTLLPGSHVWLGTPWLGTQPEKQAVQSDLDAVAQWADQNQRPIYLSEFGSYQEASLEYRIVWAAFVARSAEERHFSWAYWDFASDYGVYDLPGQEWITPLLQALIP
jgi:endoglucanase